MYSATVTPELFFLRRKYKKESLEGPSLAKVKDLEEQEWITHAEAQKELKELDAIRDDIHQEVRNVFDRIRLRRAAAGRAELLANSSSTSGGIQKVEQTAFAARRGSVGVGFLTARQRGRRVFGLCENPKKIRQNPANI